MAIPITALLTGVFAIMMVALALLVSLRRRQQKISLGDGDDDILRRRIRAHANFAEFVPFALIALGLVELTGASLALVSSMATSLLVSRVIHAYGILYCRTATLRALAMVIQHTCFLIMGVWLIVNITV